MSHLYKLKKLYVLFAITTVITMLNSCGKSSESTYTDNYSVITSSRVSGLSEKKNAIEDYLKVENNHNSAILAFAESKEPLLIDLYDGYFWPKYFDVFDADAVAIVVRDAFKASNSQLEALKSVDDPIIVNIVNQLDEKDREKTLAFVKDLFPLKKSIDSAFDDYKDDLVLLDSVDGQGATFQALAKEIRANYYSYNPRLKGATLFFDKNLKIAVEKFILLQKSSQDLLNKDSVLVALDITADDLRGINEALENAKGNLD